MSFFSPIDLLWLVPFGGALLALYLLRPNRRPFEVPSLYLWTVIAPSVRADTPFQKLKLSLLLLLQLLVFVFLIMALARPYTNPRPVQRALYAIILDQSAAMTATDVSPNRFAQAKAAAVAFLRRNLRNGDRAAVIGAAAFPVLLCPLTADRSRLAAAIAGAQPVDTPLDLQGALTFAGAAVPRATACILLSDGAWDSDVDGSLIAAAGSPVKMISFGTADALNAGIVAMSERTNPVESGHAQQLLVAVDRHRAQQAVLTVYDDGRRIASRSMPPGDGSTDELFTLPRPQTDTIVTARLTGMQRDDLADDNSASLRVKAVTVKKVLLITSGDPYLVRALALLPDAELYEETPAQYVDSAGEYDLNVFDGWAPNALPDGPSLVFDAFGPELPTRAGDETAGPSEIVDWNETDPLLSYVDLGDVHIDRSLVASADDWGTDVADLPTGPAIVKRMLGDKSTVWVGFAPGRSDFPLKVGFPIFLENCLQTLAGGAGSVVQERATGEPIVLRPVDGVWHIVRPDGTAADVPCTLKAGCSYAGTQLAGIYSARIEDVTELFAANLASRTATDIAARRHPLLETTYAGSFRRTTARTDLVPWAACAALVLVLVEWLVYNRPTRYTQRI